MQCECHNNCTIENIQKKKIAKMNIYLIPRYSPFIDAEAKAYHDCNPTRTLKKGKGETHYIDYQKLIRESNTHEYESIDTSAEC